MSVCACLLARGRHPGCRQFSDVSSTSARMLAARSPSACTASVCTGGADCSQERSSRGSHATSTWSTARGWMYVEGEERGRQAGFEGWGAWLPAGPRCLLASRCSWPDRRQGSCPPPQPTQPCPRTRLRHRVLALQVDDDRVLADLRRQGPHLGRVQRGREEEHLQ